MNFLKVFREAGGLLLSGIGCTAWVSVVSLVIAILIAILICAAGLSKIRPLIWLNKFYIWLIRGTPLLVQALIIKFAIPYFIQNTFGVERFNVSISGAAIVALSLNAGAYLSEIFRGGVLAIDRGQIEAARSLGFSAFQTALHIILPQAFKITIPSIVNQFTTTVKDTSILLAIGLPELVYQAKTYASSTMEYLSTYMVVALFYLAVISLLTLLSHYVEKKFRYDERPANKRRRTGTLDLSDVEEEVA